MNPERLVWLVIEYPRHTVEETVRLFNSEFGTSITGAQLRAAQKNHFPGVLANAGVKTPPSPYTGEELSFLRETIPDTPYGQVADLFEERFGRRLTKSMMLGQARRLGVRRERNLVRFQKGHTPANKGRKGWHPPGCEKTWFKPGHRPGNIRPMYSERFCKGAVQIKVPGPSPYESIRKNGTGFNSHWTIKARWVWERDKGGIPPGHAIVHEDGDPLNNEIDNLMCVPKGVLALLNNGNNVPQKGPAGIEPARLRLAILEYERGRRVRESGS